MPAATPLDAEQQANLAQRLGQWRRQPLSPEELAELLPRISEPHLALAVGERLGMVGPGAISLILPLCHSQGINAPLIKALGICHHPQARDQLIAWLDQAGALRAAVLESLTCWGNQIDLSIIRSALAAPARAERLAGLAMLTFRSRSMVTCELLKLTKPLLEDLRAEVVIATLRLLQRRHDPEILKAINGCISSEALPGVAESAIQALGCIGTQQSCQLLIAQAQQLQNFSLLSAVERQLQAQVRHRNWIDQTLRDNHQTL